MLMIEKLVRIVATLLKGVKAASNLTQSTLLFSWNMLDSKAFKLQRYE
jgi:hypothetical protein